ncbi:helix-turn-helix domain-containing protein [Roseococcus suduntuyensis]|uniref:Fur family iron response transcriptional regulator n=1 Tax=Roseococcus suduntuyensis TaxID=455361 RepID=A0A840A988_9PROT|nr:Fur family transcriptional regulator [Roseococcus suduntuyensis]MBB3896700.1 Fur family iron response transcriptional regulator [Roseococcus suduntuyensis]
MPYAVDATLREALRRAGLPAQGPMARLLALLRGDAETHFTAAAAARMAAAAGIAAPPTEVARLLDTLADHGLLGRLPSPGGEAVFDTVPEPHSHLVYEETAQTVDLHVSPETLLALLRQALAERPGEVEVMVRLRRPATPEPRRA